jgi:predicted ATPase
MAVLGAGRRDAPARQQSLHATLTWSHDLLGPDERVLFRRLAVFAGGWALEAAEAVCAGDGLATEAVLDTLGDLADHSLLAPRQGPGAPSRLGMLETIRAFARGKLGKPGRG